MSDDVEKRWNDPPELRRATRYTCIAAGTALAVMAASALWAYLGRSDCTATEAAVCATADRYLLAIAPAAILAIGGLGAFVRTYTVWKRGGTWPVWHGAGWVLMTLTLIYAALGAGFLTD
ncbi:hypothetical protein ACFWPA_07680 [Rhodococcus sp. NPDC058505]|uniref:hypothetical protein n=1 Tax=unclassified Rhodococcus (in: high G+C Gram-positive bacteria) TaxID=192944 RepID=UPI00364C5CF9